MVSGRPVVVFPRISVYAEKKGRCVVCGGPKTKRSRTFFQTLNPFNRTADGRPKTPADIMPEIRAERLAWLAEPLLHAQCEDRQRNSA